MNWANVAQYVVFLLVVIALVRPVGKYMSNVFEGRRTMLEPVLRPVERGIFRLTGLSRAEEMDWKRYALSFVIFTLVGTLLLYLILRLQSLLPWFDPTYQTAPVSPDLALNTAVSFSTTTTWQAYGGETTMSYFTQVVGLVGQNFLAGAAGLAVGIAFIRGFSRQQVATLGNFWVDVVRAVLWVLLPLCLIGSGVLIWQGVPMNFNAYTPVTTLEGGSQTIAQGPVAVLEFIKNLGTNGGGFFNANAAHPYENPTPLTNFIEMLAIVVLPASLTYTFGHMIKRPRQGWFLLGIMVFLFTVGLAICGTAEQTGNPIMERQAGVSRAAEDNQPGGNMEGKEVRFGIGGSVLAAVTTSNGATGSYNSAHDSYTPIGGLIPLVNMLLGEVVFGGLGTGFYSLILVVLIGLFMAGLMIGRTPEYLGKQINPLEMKLIMLYTLATPLAVLILTAIAVLSDAGRAGLTTNQGVHGFSEIIYAYSSSMANNGQNMAGLSANSGFYNVTTAIAIMIGRFGLAIPALALAGLFGQQRARPMTVGTLPTANFLFAAFVVATILIVGGLTFLPALVLGPVLEQFLMAR